MYHTKLWLSRK